MAATERRLAALDAALLRGIAELDAGRAGCRVGAQDLREGLSAKSSILHEGPLRAGREADLLSIGEHIGR